MAGQLGPVGNCSITAGAIASMPFPMARLSQGRPRPLQGLVARCRAYAHNLIALGAKSRHLRVPLARAGCGKTVAQGVCRWGSDR